jgi:hypothetical protein
MARLGEPLAPKSVPERALPDVGFWRGSLLSDFVVKITSVGQTWYVIAYEESALGWWE